MKKWTSATVPGRCAYDGTHTWKLGARILRVEGQGWTKHYCGSCALTRFNFPDTGEVTDLTDDPRYQAALKAVDPLFEEPFEDPPFDPKMAAANDK